MFYIRERVELANAFVLTYEFEVMERARRIGPNASEVFVFGVMQRCYNKPLGKNLKIIDSGME